MVTDYAPVALKPRRGCPAGAHCHKVFPYISCKYPVDINQTQELFEIGCDLKPGIEKSVAGVDCPATIERRVRRHESESHFPSPECCRRVETDRRGRVLRVDIVDISIHGIEFADFTVDGREDIRRAVEIVGVQETDHIAGRHHYPLVHRVVDSIVGFGNPFEPSVVARFKFADYIKGIVL